MRPLSDHWVLLLANAAASAILLVAALGKLVVPRPLGVALTELLGRDLGPYAPVLVRTFAVVELLAGLSLVIDETRVPGAWLVAALGAGFALFGGAGLVRRSTLGCGCLGQEGSRPLGAWSIAVGAGLVAILPINASLSSAADQTSSWPTGTAPVVTPLARRTWAPGSRDYPPLNAPASQLPARMVLTRPRRVNVCT
jgi:hypothetical protein